jgi:hypothetical protein
LGAGVLVDESAKMRRQRRKKRKKRKKSGHWKEKSRLEERVGEWGGCVGTTNPSSREQ